MLPEFEHCDFYANVASGWFLGFSVVADFRVWVCFRILLFTALATLLYQAHLSVPELPDRKCKQIRSPYDQIELNQISSCIEKTCGTCFLLDLAFLFRRTQWVRVSRSLSWQFQNKQEIIPTDPVGP